MPIVSDPREIASQRRNYFDVKSCGRPPSMGSCLAASPDLNRSAAVPPSAADPSALERLYKPARFGAGFRAPSADRRRRRRPCAPDARAACRHPLRRGAAPAARHLPERARQRAGQHLLPWRLLARAQQGRDGGRGAGAGRCRDHLCAGRLRPMSRRDPAARSSPKRARRSCGCIATLRRMEATRCGSTSPACRPAPIWRP